MSRPNIGDALHRCRECRGYEYSGAPVCAACRKLVDEIIEDEWRAFTGRWQAGPDDHVAIAEMVADELDRHDWRVVDAALDRLRCSECGSPLSRGPLGCSLCDRTHGFRYAAIETDRPGVPRGNEHAIRVNVSVVRRPEVTSATELLTRRMLLPALLVGLLPTTEQAQRISAYVKNASPEDQLSVLNGVLEDLLRR